MEDEILELVVSAVITAVRKDLMKMLMDTECCKWSKRRVKKLCKKLQQRVDDQEAIEDAKDMIRRKSVSSPKQDIFKYAHKITSI